MGVMKKAVRLHTIFTQYLLCFFLTVLLTFCLIFVSFSVASDNGLLLPANYTENQIKQQRSRIASAKIVTPDLIPDGCDYAVFSKEGAYKSGSLSASEGQNLWKAIQHGNYIFGGVGGTAVGARYYETIARADGFCTVLYSVSSQYASPVMRKFFPGPEILLFTVFLLVFLLEAAFFSTLFGRKISLKLQPLQKATERIQNQELDFEVQYGGIQEIDDVLSSISDMKAELKRSLERQWHMEQRKKEQTSALAHDIKTPLTVIRGNAELLRDSEQTDDQKEYTDYILKNSERMEEYLKALISLTRAEQGYSVQLQEVQTETFLKELSEQASGLAAAKQLLIDFCPGNLPAVFPADAGLFQRALMNVVSNAADFSPEHGTIYIRITVIGDCIEFQITDEGKGFSPKDLKEATGQFYMGDSSRSAKSHYGIGLTFAESIVKQHGGTLRLANSPETGGGQVTIHIPV